MRRIVVSIMIVLVLFVAVATANAEQVSVQILDLTMATDEELAAALTLIQQEQKARIHTTISLSEQALTLEKGGKAAVLKASVIDLQEGVQAGKFKWSTSNDKVVTVTDGKLKVIGGGTAVITCETTLSDGTELRSECNITVVVPVSALALSDAKLKIYNGETGKLKVTVKPEDATEKGYTFSTSDPSIATVDSSGTITAKKDGTCKITVTSKSNPKKTATCTVTVPSFKESCEAVSYYDLLHYEGAYMDKPIKISGKVTDVDDHLLSDDITVYVKSGSNTFCLRYIPNLYAGRPSVNDNITVYGLSKGLTTMANYSTNIFNLHLDFDKAPVIEAKYIVFK